MPILNKVCEALIRDRIVGQPDVGQRVTKLKQGRDALIRDRHVGQKGRSTTSANADLRLRCPHP